ncbi:sigma-70 family RNA polymerase sigma factor [Tsukamurella sp. 8F]|uniref:sigma-70 family RNA polymerase sigma factor n=1 Tax=unclassified Tsukamurella TaxID=2633480 RepID=UPI0023B907D7|nr:MULTISPECIES: sigma-70 family RNA polymerase sigma factor [unclassified Tsukamurella]MDF0528736.1 sigma-70 family RNA polymerase sigma factor [Tsukamurella sp. 8J]MDF0585698.1 sigma-70 family RNA polymerase sigma factor [Tsukamurella sp. 8F]
MTFVNRSYDRDDEVTALALEAGRGDSRALTAFIEATQRDVLRLVAYLGSPQDADDLAQETYVRAIGALHRFEGRSPARMWLLAIARRTVVDSVRRAQARPRAATGGALAAHHDSSGSVDDVAARVELWDMVDRLAPERREALLLTQVLGFGYAETAEITGCPVGTIRSRVARARADLLAAQRPAARPAIDRTGT